MAHTPEQRDQHALCGAKTRTTTKTCRNFAGQKTDHPGVGRCYLHGGRSPTHMKNAITIEARRRLALFASPVDVTSAEALRFLLHATAGHVNLLQERIQGLSAEDLEKFEGQVTVTMYDRERDRLHQIAKTCSEAGLDAHVDPRLVHSAGQNAAVIRSFCDRIGLTDEQLILAPAALKGALMEIGPQKESDGDDLAAEWEEMDSRQAQAEGLGLWTEESGEARSARLRAVGFWDRDPRAWEAYVAAEEQAREAQRRQYEKMEGIPPEPAPAKPAKGRRR